MKEKIAEYLTQGYLITGQTDEVTQLTKPKEFDWRYGLLVAVGILTGVFVWSGAGVAIVLIALILYGIERDKVVHLTREVS